MSAERSTSRTTRLIVSSLDHRLQPLRRPPFGNGEPRANLGGEPAVDVQPLDRLVEACGLQRAAKRLRMRPPVAQPAMPFLEQPVDDVQGKRRRWRTPEIGVQQ